MFNYSLAIVKELEALKKLEEFNSKVALVNLEAPLGAATVDQSFLQDVGDTMLGASSSS